MGKGAVFLPLMLLFAAGALICASVMTQAAPADAPVTQTVQVPVIVYHSVLKDTGMTGPYVVTPGMLEEDLLYLSEHGYHTVSARQLISFVDGGAPLPDRPVLITFDDGYLNNLEYAVPLLDRFGMCAIISAVGEYCETYTQSGDRNAAYVYLSWDDVAALDESSSVEIGNHSYDMHSTSPRAGASRKPGEPQERYIEAFTADTARMQRALIGRSGVESLIYAYPFGEISEGSGEELKDFGFRMTLSCYEHVNEVAPYDSASLYEMGRFNRSGELTTGEFMARAGIT